MNTTSPSHADNGGEKARRIHRLRDCRILYVEDDPRQRYALALELICAGAKVELEWNGQGAVDLVSSWSPGSAPFDVILTDVEMPLLDGCAATRILRERGYQIPVIALSGNPDPNWKEQCYQSGCNQCLDKPVVADQLISVLRKYCRGRDIP